VTANAEASFTQTLYEAAVVVEAHGSLNVVGVPGFRAALQRAVETDKALVVIDLADVSFLDSAGLAVVFRAQRLLPVSQKMVLVNVPDRMRRVLRLAGVNAVVDVQEPGDPQPWLEQV